MNELNIFENPEFGSIRTTIIDNEPWFVGKDVATALGYKNSRQAVLTNVDEEDKGVHSVDTLKGTQNMTIINESGLYCLILSSKLPNAKKFKRWVTSEVLPTLRKTGTYIMPQQNIQRDLITDDYLKAAQIVSRCKNERLHYVLNFLEQAGFDIPEVKSKLIRSVVNSSVVGFLQSHDDVEVENIPTNVVYDQYKNYCDRNNLVALCNGEFSKQIKRTFGLSVIDKKVQGKKYRIFAKV